MTQCESVADQQARVDLAAGPVGTEGAGVRQPFEQPDHPIVLRLEPRILLALVEALLFGLGVAFLAFGLLVVRMAAGPVGVNLCKGAMAARRASVARLVPSVEGAGFVR